MKCLFWMSLFSTFFLSVAEPIDICIIGSGPAGLAAGVYGARSKLKTVVITGENYGGQLTGSGEVENWPGIVRMRGSKIMENFFEQARSVGTEFIEDLVVKVDFSHRPFKIFTEEHGKLEAQSVIIATGSLPKLLQISGEQEYWGRGVSSCAVCDCFLYQDRDVAIVGGGDSAIEEALHLAPYARSITIFVRKSHMRATARMQDKLLEYPHINVCYNTRITEIIGNELGVNGLQIENAHTGVRSYFPVDGLFLAIGHTPNTELFFEWLLLAPDGHIELACRSQETKIPGLFVAGDVADNRFRQAGIAAGSGIQAALEAIDFLRYNN